MYLRVRGILLIPRVDPAGRKNDHARKEQVVAARRFPQGQVKR